MSADNAIYIRPMKDGKFRIKELRSFYGHSLTQDQADSYFFSEYEESETEFEAEEIAEKLIEKIEDGGGYVEYGTEVLARE